MSTQTTTPQITVEDAIAQVLGTAVAFHGADVNGDSGIHERATLWAEFNSALMEYHIAELATFRGGDPKEANDVVSAGQGDARHNMMELDGQQAWCTCGYHPSREGWGLEAQRILVNLHAKRLNFEATK